jgi:hypothetical protein
MVSRADVAVVYAAARNAVQAMQGWFAITLPFQMSLSAIFPLELYV